MTKEEIEALIDARIKEKLELTTNSVAYDGNYLRLKYDDTILGESVCLTDYEDY